jgi:hypothetical protein
MRDLKFAMAELERLDARERAICIARVIGRFGWTEQRTLWRTLTRHLIRGASAVAPSNGTAATAGDVLALLHSDLDGAADSSAPSAGSSAGFCADSDGAEHRHDAHGPERAPYHNFSKGE